MTKVIPQRMTAQIEGDFVVFLIGMRINRPWKLHKWLPVFLAMPKMLKELERRPNQDFSGRYSGQAPRLRQGTPRRFLPAMHVETVMLAPQVEDGRDADDAVVSR